MVFLFFLCSWQKQVTVKYSVLEVLLEITKYCDLYLMERVLDDESEVRVNLFASIICSSSYAMLVNHLEHC